MPWTPKASPKRIQSGLMSAIPKNAVESIARGEAMWSQRCMPFWHTPPFRLRLARRLGRVVQSTPTAIPRLWLRDYHHIRQRSLFVLYARYSSWRFTLRYCCFQLAVVCKNMSKSVAFMKYKLASQTVSKCHPVALFCTSAATP